MRRIIIAIVLSILFAVAAHFLPPGYDSWDGALYEGRSIKIFWHGCPITYVVEGPMRDQPWAIVLKLAANITLMSVVFCLIAAACSKFRARNLPS